ncbi:MAG: GHKL domain-containing protein, partial [Candidatus Latescibacteria bacterium]|nr:GHKL domain-containing protein [Candidatus Latescibacterota bacterium]
VLGKLAAVVAHELNNPLAAISMYNQMMESELPEPSPFDEHIDVIKRNTKSCQQIIHDLLDYARIPQPKIQETDLHKLLNDVVLFLRPLHGDSSISIVRNFESDDAICWGDPTQLQQVFVNLLVNAIQAVDEQSGTVRMYTRDVDEGRAIAVRIEDNGSGIDEAHRKDIFDPFFTTKSIGGTGLGLSTSARIIEAHEGTLELSSSKPGHTVFQVILPHLRTQQTTSLVQIESDETIGITI